MADDTVPGTVFPTWQAVFEREDPRSRIPRQDLFLTDEAYMLLLYKNSQPSWAIKQAKWGIMHRLETCIQAKYGSRYELGLFGSTAYGLDTNDTDLDICVVDTHHLIGGKAPGVPHNHPYALDHLASCIYNAGFSVKTVIKEANTPIIIALDPSTSISFDLNVNSLGGLYNSLFLSTHSRLSPHTFLPLANYLKIWARLRVSSHPPTIATKVTSSSLAILLLAYLVSVGAVEDLLVRKEGHAGNWIEEELRVPKKRKRKQEEVPYWPQAFATESAGGSEAEGGDLRELLEGFFAWVAEWRPFAAKEEMASLRAPMGGNGRMSRASSAKFAQETALIVVQDPFITDRNLMATLSAETVKRFFQESQRASDLLRNGTSARDVLRRP